MGNYEEIERKIDMYNKELMHLESDKRDLEIRIDSGCYEDDLEELEDELMELEHEIENCEWNLNQLHELGNEE